MAKPRPKRRPSPVVYDDYDDDLCECCYIICTSELTWIIFVLLVAFIGLMIYDSKTKPATGPLNCARNYENEPYLPMTDSEKLLKKYLLEQVSLSPGLDIPCTVHCLGQTFIDSFFRRWRDYSRPQCQLSKWNESHALRYLEFVNEEYASMYRSMINEEDRFMLFGLVLTFHEGGVFVGDTRSVPNSVLDSWIDHKGKFSLVALFDSVCDALNNSEVKSRRDLVIIAEYHHPIIRDAILRIKQKYKPGDPHHESPYTSFYKVIGDAISADWMLCQNVKQTTLKEPYGVLLVPSGDNNPLWLS